MFTEFEWWIAAIALFAGCAIQTALGFGMAVIAAPIIVILKPEWVPYVLTVVALTISLRNAWHNKGDIQWATLWSPLLTRIPGTLVGTWLLILMPIATLQIAVAAMVFMTVIVSLWLKPFDANKVNLGIAGFASGITGTTTSIGGPPMALVMQHSDSKEVRANLSVYFTYSCSISILAYIYAGLMDWEMAKVSLSFVPVALIGFYFGRFIQDWVDQSFRPILLTLCGIAACIAMGNAIW